MPSVHVTQIHHTIGNVTYSEQYFYYDTQYKSYDPCTRLNDSIIVTKVCILVLTESLYSSDQKWPIPKRLCLPQHSANVSSIVGLQEERKGVAVTTWVYDSVVGGLEAVLAHSC